MVKYLCEVAGVSRSGYYRYFSPSAQAQREQREARDEESKTIILQAFRYKNRTKGARQIPDRANVGRRPQFEEGNLIWFDYFQQNEAFFTTILSSKGAPTFRTSFVIEELEANVDTATGLNEGLSREIVLRFFGAAIVEIVEAWITGGLTEPAEVVARQMGSLLDRNL